nr:ribonuclease R [Deinococcus deserti]
MKKQGEVPVEAVTDAVSAEQPIQNSGQRRRNKAAAPQQTEDTVTTKKSTARRGQAAPASEPAADAPVTRRRKNAAAEAPVAQAAPARRGRPARKTPASATEAELPAFTPPEPEVSAPVKRGRKPKAATPPIEAASPAAVDAVQEDAIPESAALPETAADEPAAPVPVSVKRRRGRPARVAAAEPAAPTAANDDTILDDPRPMLSPDPVEAEPATPPVKRGRKPRAKAMEPTPALADAEPIEVAGGGQSAEPVILEVPKRRGRPRKQPAALPLLDGVEPVEAGEAPAAAVQTITQTTQEPLVDSSAVNADPAGAVVTGGAAQPLSEPAAPRPSRRPRKAKAATPTADVEVQVQNEAPVASTPESDPEPASEASEDTDTDTDLLERDPAQALVVAQLRKLGRPVHVRDLERTFTRQMMNRLGDWRDLEALLETLVESGTVVRTRRRTYGLPEAMSLVRGKFQASAAGFGFVVPDSGGEDYYIPAEQTLEAWNGDIVLVRMEGRGDSGRGGGPRRGQRGDGNPRASVVRIVQRAYSKLVGTLEFHHGHPILKPDDHRARHRILVLPEGLEGLQAGARVVTELFWPENTGEDEVFGQVVRVLGEQDDPETETEAVIVKFGLRGEFPGEVMAEAAAIPTEIPAEALVGRLDLREFNIFTVDGRDAKDFDDAIHIQPTPEGTFVVGVHIADVSHYVREGTPLDDEAYARATSVYLPGRVLPMLPEHLSNGVCSLVPYQDRLTMTALVELSAEGDILDVKIAPSVINSKARLTYDEVQAYSEATATLPDHARHLEGDLHLLLKITSKLRQKRLREGSLDFKMREVKVDVGPDGRMELIPIREETARGMIEDLMLLANKVVAHYLLQREIPTLFRIHEEPTLQRFQEVSQAIGRLGLAFPGGEPTPQAYQAVLKQVRGTPRESVVNTLLLRSMQQAKYAGENLGHFGLAFDEYLHFTSPIRRYPDLMVHRVLKGVLGGELKAGNREVAKLQGRLPAMGDHTSDRERTAAEAERDLTKYYQAKWAQEHLQETFAGNVSGVVASGLYVALDNGVEGKLHISNLDDDYYVYIEDAQMLRGRSGGRTFRLGDSVTVTISAVNPMARMIDLTLGDSTQERDMNEVKPRARRREEREAERREKLQSVTPTAPRKFTLDDPQPAVQSAPARQERTGAGGRGYERDRSGDRRGPGQQGRTFGGVSMGPRLQGGARRVITLERPRNEHLRPVNITVQRMYFGDWTLENMPPEEPQGGRGGRFDRPDRASSERGNRGYTRGSNDRGAVGRVNGRPGGPQGQTQPAPRAPQAAAPVSDSQSDEAKRRRRRRGRRGGTGGQSQD